MDTRTINCIELIRLGVLCYRYNKKADLAIQFFNEVSVN